MSERSKSDTKEPTQVKQIDLNEITKPLRIKLCRNDFASLIKVVVNNLDNKDYQTKINNDNYDLNNAEQVLPKIAAKKVIKNEVHELHKNLIEPKVDKLTNANGKSNDKRSNILNILENIESSIFDGYYYHYFDKPKITKKKCCKKGTIKKTKIEYNQRERK